MTQAESDAIHKFAAEKLEKNIEWIRGRWIVTERAEDGTWLGEQSFEPLTSGDLMLQGMGVAGEDMEIDISNDNPGAVNMKGRDNAAEQILIKRVTDIPTAFWQCYMLLEERLSHDSN